MENNENTAAELAMIYMEMAMFRGAQFSQGLLDWKTPGRPGRPGMRIASPVTPLDETFWM
ncbi:MAG: hypothetical protein ACYCOR_08260 [Acidobacteriaceae bacterium]